MWAILAERKKHRVFREVWVSYIIEILFEFLVAYFAQLWYTRRYERHLILRGYCHE